MNIEISKIENLAQTVASEFSASQAAHAAAELAEGELLRDIIAAMKPAIPALSNKIVKHSYETGGQNGCNPVSRKEHHSERGFLLVDGYERTRDATGNRGDLAGSRLFLLIDGRLAEVTREGSFSVWQGEADEWESTLEILAADVVAERYDIEEILATIAEALTKAVGSREKATAKAIERAERVSAISRLVRR
jgi:hypothetical protein